MADPILDVEKFTMTMADTVTSVTANLSASDIADLIPRVSYLNSSGTEEGWNDLQVDVEFLTGPNRVQLTRSTGDGEIVAKVAVIELDTAGDINVQTAAMSVTGSSLSVSITAVVLAKSFATFGFEFDQETNYNDAYLRAMLTTTTNLEFTRGSGIGTCDGHWWVVEDDGSNFDVQRVQALTTNQVSADATITSVVEGRTMTLCAQSLSTAGENPDDIAIGFLFDDTTFRITRDSNAGDLIVDAFIVEFTNGSGVEVQRGTITMGSGVSTGTQANTAVVLANSWVHCPMVPNGCSSDDLTSRNSAYASIEQNSNIQIEANGNDDSSTEIVPWELIEFNLAVQDEPAVFFGTNF